MKYAQLVKRTAEESGVSERSTERVMDAFRRIVADSLEKGESVKLSKIGVFEAVPAKERPWINPLSKKKGLVPAHRRAAFRVSKRLRDALR